MNTTIIDRLVKAYNEAAQWWDEDTHGDLDRFLMQSVLDELGWDDAQRIVFVGPPRPLGTYRLIREGGDV